MVILRDGRKLQGVFRSYDQYGELVYRIRRVMLNYISFLYRYSYPLLVRPTFSHIAVRSIT